MAQKHMVKLILLTGIFMWLTLPVQAQETIECAEDVIVQVDDWLSKLSDKFYGDVLAFPAIAEATNTKSLEDNTYATIEDVDLIEPGWKLCIVGVPAAEQILGFSLDNAPAGDDTPTNLTGVIKIGAAHALSGPLSAQGQSIQKGINLAAAEINQSGLLGEAQLELIWEDTAGNSDQARAIFAKLISQDEVVAILGPTLSHSAFLANPVAQAAGVPVIGSSNIVEGVTEMGSFIFRTSLPEK
jgi:ABC-type branched-subunit amino acid transport system substrate-binding protein